MTTTASACEHHYHALHRCCQREKLPLLRDGQWWWRRKPRQQGESSCDVELWPVYACCRCGHEVFMPEGWDGDAGERDKVCLERVASRRRARGW